MASTRLTKTISANGTSQYKTTISVWVKRAKLGLEQHIVSGWISSANRTTLRFKSDDSIELELGNGGTWYSLRTNKLFRDTSSWLHFTAVLDPYNSTQAQRMRLYVNGSEETSFQSTNYPSQSNIPTGFSSANCVIAVGCNTQNGSSFSNYFDGSMSHIHVIDGTAYAASTFGSTDSTTGEWKINTSPSVTYGTNGFFILKDGNSVTDASPNTNNFTVGAGTLTKTEDNPSNNFATGNPLIGIHSNGSVLVPQTYSNGNLTSTSSGQQWRIHQSTLGASSGKYYAEFKWISDTNTRYAYIGIYSADDYANKISGYPYLSDMAHCYGLKDSNGNIHTGGSGTSYGVSYGPSNIIGVAMDLDNNKLYFSKDGTWMNSANPSNGTGGYSITADKTYMFGIQQYSAGTIVLSANYGNGYFQTTAISTNSGNGHQDADGNGKMNYSVPTNYRCLCTKGLNQ